MTDEFETFLREEKNWFNNDEYVECEIEETFIGNGLYRWTTETYIPFVSLQCAMDDEDVVVGDLHVNDGHIYMYDGREQEDE